MRRVAVIGPGRVGTALALALPPERYRVVAVAGRGAPALERFTVLVPTATVLPVSDAGRHADLVLVCVPDDAVRGTVRAVARDDGVREGSRWVHVAGGHGLDVLRPARLAGAEVAACHPAQTFPDPQSGAAALPGTAWAVTADSSARAWARELVHDLGGEPFEVPDAARTLYHVGLVAGSNFVTAMVGLARDLLRGAGIERPEAFLAPLATTSAAHAAERGASTLTGPVRRGDAGTVARHLAELETVMPEVIEAYVAVSRVALGYARRAGLDEQAAAAVVTVLERAADQER